MATTLAPGFNTRIVSPAADGEITRDLHSGDGSSTWKKGQLLKLASGVLAPVLALGSSPASVDTDEMPVVDVDGADAIYTQYFIALEDVTASSAKCAVRRITSNTVFEGPLCDSGTGPATAPESIVGLSYGLYQLATGDWFADQNNDTGSNKTCVQITKVQSQFIPITEPSWQGLTSTNYPLVQFKFLPSVVGL